MSRTELVPGSIVVYCYAADPYPIAPLPGLPPAPRP
jgi:hypothetical protein